MYQGAASVPLEVSLPKQGAAMTKPIERPRQSKNCYCLAEAYIGGDAEGREPGENHEKFSLLFGFSPFDDGWYCARANVSASGKSRGWSKLHDSELHRSQSLCASTWGRHSWRRPRRNAAWLYVARTARWRRLAQQYLARTAYLRRCANQQLATRTRKAKIGSSARKSKRKNYRTMRQRRDISMDVRQVRRRPLVRVTRPVQ